MSQMVCGRIFSFSANICQKVGGVLTTAKIFRQIWRSAVIIYTTKSGHLHIIFPKKDPPPPQKVNIFPKSYHSQSLPKKVIYSPLSPNPSFPLSVIHSQLAGSPFREELNKGILKMQEFGRMEMLYKKWISLPGSECASQQDGLIGWLSGML